MSETGQIDLFGDQAEHRRIRRSLLIDTPATRRTDPTTSLKAETKLRKSGALGAQQRQVLEAVLRWPGRTAVELAALMARAEGHGEHTERGVRIRYMVSRRIADLARAELIRRGIPRICEINNTSQNTYYPTARGAAACPPAT